MSLKFQSFFAYGSWACLVNRYQRDFPIVYVGGCIKRTHKESEVINYLYITCIIKSKGLEVDNCCQKPIYCGGKSRLKVKRHSVDLNGCWSELSLQQLHSNDGALYPSVLEEGVILYDNNKCDNSCFFLILIGNYRLSKWL